MLPATVRPLPPPGRGAHTSGKMRLACRLAAFVTRSRRWSSCCLLARGRTTRLERAQAVAALLPRAAEGRAERANRAGQARASVALPRGASWGAVPERATQVERRLARRARRTPGARMGAGRRVSAAAV